MPIRLPQATVESWIRDCDESQTFVCIDGQRARSIKDMVKVLEKISEENYYYHVNNDKNDLAAWVEGVFHNGHLSANFRSARSLKEAYQYCKRHSLMLERNMRDFKLREAYKACRKKDVF